MGIDSKNPIITYIEEILEKKPEEKIVLYGCGTLGQIIYMYLKVMGKTVAYFVDNSVDKQGTKQYDTEIKSVYDLLYEESYVCFFCIKYGKTEAKNDLADLGLIEDRDYFDIARFWDRREGYEILDCFCGVSWASNIEGYKRWGEDSAKHRVLILGGSTSDPTYTMFNSWGYYFYNILKEKYQSDVVVYSGAVTGYTTAQSLLKVMRDGLILKPDVVIDLSGVNDAHEKGGYVMVSEYLQYVLGKIFSEGNSKEQFNSWSQNDRRMRSTKSCSFGLQAEQDNISRWENNIRMTNAICSEFGISYYAILQPTSTVGKSKDKVIKKFDALYLPEERIKVWHDFYLAAKDLCKKYSYIYDMSDVFENVEGAVYFDHVHYTEYGNKILAEKIFELVEQG